MIVARRVLVFKRYVDNKHESAWKGILDYFLSEIGEKKIFYSVTLILGNCPSIFRFFIRNILMLGLR